jgi:hypothetical protein
MTLLSALAIGFTLLSPSDVAIQSPVFSPEVANRIEQRTERNQMKESFIFTMNEQTYPEPSPTHPSQGGWDTDGYNSAPLILSPRPSLPPPIIISPIRPIRG